jgi:hypothetical protein
MKKLITIFLVCACVLLTTTAARGGLVFSFDENGHGNINNNGVITPLTFDVGIPPKPPVAIATLYYVLPITVTEGDVWVIEFSTSNLSDVLRFVNSATGGSRVYVYSNLPEAGELPPYDLADVGNPNINDPDQVLPNHIGRQEEGSEYGWSGLRNYEPTSTLPGGNPNPGGALRTYNFTSDVPEPTTIALLGLGALSLLRRKR